MDNSRDKRVQSFLDDLQDLKPEQCTVIKMCRKMVFQANPNVSERFIYGGIMFSLNGEDFGGVFASKKHVSFEFGKGIDLDDPIKNLEGVGKFRRHLKLRTLEDVEKKTVGYYIQQLNLNK